MYIVMVMFQLNINRNVYILELLQKLCYVI